MHAPRPLWIKLCACVGVLVLLLFVAVATWMSVGDRRMSLRIAEIRARGEPASMAEIEFDRDVPPSDLSRRAREFQAAEELWIDIDFGDPWEIAGILPHWPEGQGAAPAMESFARCNDERQLREGHHEPFEFVAGCRDPRQLDRLDECQRLGLEARQLLHEPCIPQCLLLCAASRETGETAARDWHVAEVFAPTDDIMVMIRACRYLLATVPHLVLSGRTSVAVSRIEAMLQGANAIEGLPWTSAHVAWLFCMDRVLQGCRLLVASHATSLEVDAIRERLATIDPRPNLERALLGQRALLIEVFRNNPRRFPDNDGFFGGDGLLDLAQLRVMAGWDGLVCLDLFEVGIAASLAHPWAAPNWRPSQPPDESSLPTWAKLSRWHTPDIGDLQAWTRRLEADLLLAQAAFEAHAMGEEAGRRLCAETPDPFGGRPLCSRVEDGVLVLWSIGSNFTDDGGSSAILPRENYEADIAWYVRLR